MFFLLPKKSTHPRKFICSLRGCRYPDSFGSFGFQVSINQELLFKKPSLYNLFLASKKVYIGRYISYKPQNFGEVSYVNPISLDDKSSNFVFALIRWILRGIQTFGLRPDPDSLLQGTCETKDTKAYGIHRICRTRMWLCKLYMYT